VLRVLPVFLDIQRPVDQQQDVNCPLDQLL
jgi:hypothetical protein